jgi:hypothetical protein
LPEEVVAEVRVERFDEEKIRGSGVMLVEVGEKIVIKNVRLGEIKGVERDRVSVELEKA